MTSATVELRPAIERLQDWRQSLRARLRQSFAESAETLLEFVDTRLSGGVLRTRSGVLRASLRTEVTEADDGFDARVWSDGSVPYARIQEYGGRIAIPDVTVKNAKVLAFPFGGKVMFAKRVAAHVITIPERSYMRSSLAEFAPLLVDSIRKLATDASR